MIIVILILPYVKVNAQVETTPQIINNNPEFIPEYTNPIILNWTVIDDNLHTHQIYGNENLLNEKDYNGTADIQTNITLEITLGNGEYNLTLVVTDYDNNTSTHTTNLLKGEPVENLEEVNFPFQVMLISIPLLLKLNKKSSKFS